MYRFCGYGSSLLLLKYDTTNNKIIAQKNEWQKKIFLTDICFAIEDIF
jgi:hypothetical protein